MARALRELLLALGVTALAAATLWGAGQVLNLQHRLLDWVPTFSSWIVAALLTTVVSYPVRALLALRRQREERAAALAGELRLLAAIGAALFAALALLVIELVHLKRIAEPNPAAKVNLFPAFRFAGELALWSTAGAGLTLLALLWALVGVTWARRDPRGGAASLAAIVGLAAITGCAGLALLRYGGAMAAVFRLSMTASERILPEQRYEVTLHSGDPLVQGRWALLVVAVIAAAAVVLAARRERRPAPGRVEIAAAGLFALGLAAFAFTRGAAHDARHPLPLLDGALGDVAISTRHAIDEDWVAALPTGRSCTPGLPESPTLVIVTGSHGSIAFLQGTEPASLAAFPKELERSKAFWLQLNPGKSFPGRFEAMIAAKQPMAEIAPFLAAARAAGYVDVDVIEALPQRTYVTRTLGEIAYRPRVCHVPSGRGVEVPKQGTWGDFAASLP